MPTDELDERLAHLRFDLNAMIDWEKATGMSVVHLDLDRLAKDLGAQRALLWAMLKNLDPKRYPQAKDTTMEDAGRLMTLSTMKPITELMVAAIMDGLPLPTQGAEGEEKKN